MGMKMTFEAYLEAIGGRCDSVATAATGFDDRKTTDRDLCGETVATVGKYEIAQCGNDFHAFEIGGDDERQSIGYMIVESGQTDLAVSAEYEGNGIGYALMLTCRREHPLHQAGCVSCGGERLLRRVFETLKAEGLV